MTLKTGVIQLYITGINYIVHIQIEHCNKCQIVMMFHNITIFAVFLIQYLQPW